MSVGEHAITAKLRGGFVRVPLTLPESDLVHAIAERLRRDPTWVLGALVRLDCWLAQQDHSGDLRALRGRLPALVGWTSRKGREALVEAFHDVLAADPDRPGVYVDWVERWAPVRAKRQNDARRQREARASGVASASPPPPPPSPPTVTRTPVPSVALPPAIESPARSSIPEPDGFAEIAWNGVTHRLPLAAKQAIEDPTSVTDPSAPEACGYAWEAWRLYIGEVDFGRFRKHARPMLVRYGFADMLGAMQVWRAHRRAVSREDSADALRFLTLSAFLEQAENLVRLSKQPIEDEHGRPTERGRFTSHYVGRQRFGKAS